MYQHMAQLFPQQDFARVPLDFVILFFRHAEGGTEFAVAVRMMMELSTRQAELAREIDKQRSLLQRFISRAARSEGSGAALLESSRALYQQAVTLNQSLSDLGVRLDALEKKSIAPV